MTRQPVVHRPFFKYLLLPLAWSAVIFFLSAQPSLPGSKVFVADFIIKKTAHLSEFAILFWCWWYFGYRTAGKKVAHYWWLILLVCLIYALLDEYHQSFVPGRTATWRDVGFDFLGSSLACLWSRRII